MGLLRSSRCLGQFKLCQTLGREEHQDEMEKYYILQEQEITKVTNYFSKKNKVLAT